MKDTFLKSKLGKRFFGLFVACAIFPVILLGTITFFHAKSQIKRQGKRELQQSTKAIGMSIYERFILLDNELKRVPSMIDTERVKWRESKVQSNLFESIYYFKSKNHIIHLFGDNSKGKNILPSSKLLEPQKDKTKIYTQKSKPGAFQVFVSRKMRDAQNPEQGFIAAQVKASFLWNIGAKNILPPQTELCVTTTERNVIFSSFGQPELIASKIPQTLENNGHQRSFVWSNRDTKYFASYWPVFMKSKFESQNWIVILSKKKTDMFAPIAGYQKNFLLVIVLAILSVFLFSVDNIRRILVPLDQIKKGIQNITNENFNVEIEVNSNDEFYEVAQTFNDMSNNLDQQFKTINNMAQVDRAILSSLESETIVHTVIQGILELTSCTLVVVIRITDKYDDFVDIHYSLADSDQIKHKQGINFSFESHELCSSHKQPIKIDCNKSLPPCVIEDYSDYLETCWGVPIFIENELTAFACLCYIDDAPSIDKDLEKTQQLTNQMAVALANSNLVEALDRLHLGAITALAKTVDAKSSWTAGHSERVCEYAIETANILQCDQKMIDTIRQAALLHDIGKVGIPNAILDKPGKLTREEFERIMRHPNIGASILEPIKEYSQVIPIVAQHHERYDGKGYPEGIKGTEIALEARIMAVADAFDAMTSDRPYRSSMSFLKAVTCISEGSGTQFDPMVVKAFLTFLNTKHAHKLRADS